MSKPYSLSIQEMYTLSSPNNATFGIQGYDTPKIYQDPLHAIKERERAKIPKGQRPKGKQPNKGHYLEDLKKMSFGPGPSAHGSLAVWNKETKTPKNISKTISKNTFIDIIFRDAEKRKPPGPGSYNLRRSEEDAKKETEKLKSKPKINLQRSNFLCDYEFISNAGPGPGAYNPHDKIKKLHANNTQPDQLRKKHKELELKQLTYKLPAVGSYNPLSPALKTFESIQKDSLSKKGAKAKSNFFGVAERFKDPKMTKSKSLVNFPGPSQYQLNYEWNGKNDSKNKEKNKKNLSKILSNGVEKSIYYDNED